MFMLLVLEMKPWEIMISDSDSCQESREQSVVAPENNSGGYINTNAVGYLC
jgi:hypothetical protein